MRPPQGPWAEKKDSQGAGASPPRYRCFLPDLAGSRIGDRPHPGCQQPHEFGRRGARPPRPRARRSRAPPAERKGFEPLVPCGTHDFQSCTFGLSVISPELDHRLGRNHNRHGTKGGRFRRPPSFVGCSTESIPLATSWKMEDGRWKSEDGKERPAARRGGRSGGTSCGERGIRTPGMQSIHLISSQAPSTNSAISPEPGDEPRGGSAPARRDGDLRSRNAAKKSVRTCPHGAASTPPVTWRRWLSRASVAIRKNVSTAPAFGSDAP